jgi:hypothetical protein
MTTLPEIRDLARQLLTYEADAGDGSEPVESTTLRVYGKLRQSLGELAGTAGFQSLAFRALTLARLEVPSLSAVQVAADGNLEGMTAMESAITVGQDQVHEGGTILISRLLGLFFIFLGEALTMNLVQDVWPDAALDDCESKNGRNA